MVCRTAFYSPWPPQTTARNVLIRRLDFAYTLKQIEALSDNQATSQRSNQWLSFCATSNPLTSTFHASSTLPLFPAFLVQASRAPIAMFPLSIRSCPSDGNQRPTALIAQATRRTAKLGSGRNHAAGDHVVRLEQTRDRATRKVKSCKERGVCFEE